MLVGANPDELKDLATRMDDAATKLAPIHGQVLGLIERSPWEGPNAEAYHRQWRDAKGRLDAATHLLRSASDVLRRNADAQLRTSAAEGGHIGGAGVQPGGSGPSGAGGSPRVDSMLERVSDFLEALGIGGSVLDTTLDTLKRLVDEGVLDVALIESLVGNKTLLKVVELGGHVIDAASALVTFAIDMSENSDLPMDERLFHALAVTAIDFAASEGIEAGLTFLGGAIGSVVPGAGTAVGGIAGRAVGSVVAIGVEYFLGDAIDGAGEWAADRMTEVYQDAKAAVPTDVIEVGQDIIGGIKDAPGHVIDGAGDVIDAVGDAGSTVVDVVTFW